jgi:ankyrin repeat protein
VELLLDNGADVHSQGVLYDNALQAASLGGHKQIVRLLLDSGVNQYVSDRESIDRDRRGQEVNISWDDRLVQNRRRENIHRPTAQRAIPERDVCYEDPRQPPQISSIATGRRVNGQGRREVPGGSAAGSAAGMVGATGAAEVGGVDISLSLARASEAGRSAGPRTPTVLFLNA